MTVDERTLLELVRHAATPMAVVAGPPWRIVGHGPDWPEPLGGDGSTDLIESAAGAAAVRLCDLASLTVTARHVDVPVGRRRHRIDATPVPAADGRVTHVLLAVRERPPHRTQVGGGVDGRLVARFDRDLRVTDANDAVIEASGLERSQMVGRTNREMGYPEHLADLWDRHHRHVLTTGQPVELGYDLPGVEGIRRYRTMVLPEFDGSGRVTGVVVISAAADDADKEPTDHLISQVAPEPAGVSVARRELADHADRVGATQVADAVELVVSELVSNAVEHGGDAPVEVGARRLEHLYQLWVRQRSAGAAPRPVSSWTMPSSDSRRGRGLAIVRALAESVELVHDDGVLEIRCTFDLGAT